MKKVLTLAEACANLNIDQTKGSQMTTQLTNKQVQNNKINWSAVKTNIIVAFVFVTAGLIGGYFTSINVITDTRQNVIEDIKATSVVTVPALKDQK